MSPLPLDVPALRTDLRGNTVVTRWGSVCGFTFRAGDRVVVGPEHGGGLVLLRPRGYGWPMLGRRSAGGLVAEPGGVPAAAQRWEVVGGVLAVERELERAVSDGGERLVSVRIRQSDSREPVGVDCLSSRVAKRFAGGRLTAPELDALCLRAALAPEQFGLELAIGASQDPLMADALGGGASFGCVAVDVRGGIQDCGAGRVIIGPWAEAALPSSAGLAAVSAARDAVQLNLFGGGPPDDHSTPERWLRRSS